jgi:hypothetical protein
MSEAKVASDIEQALAWLIDNSDGVAGLRLDGEVMPWDEVVRLYLPWWSAEGVERRLPADVPGLALCPVCGANLDSDGVCPDEDEHGPGNGRGSDDA